MKIYHSIPEETPLFSHDAVLIKILKVAIPVFILISSVTVFFGVQTTINNYLEELNLPLYVPAYLIGFFLFSITPDTLNFILVGYLARTFLKGYYRNWPSFFLIGICSLSVIGLTYYSYQMSMNSAKSVAIKLKGEERPYDGTEIKNDKERQIQKLLELNKTEERKLEREYNVKLENQKELKRLKLKSYGDQIEQWEHKRRKSNTKYVDMKIRKIRSKIDQTKIDFINYQKGIFDSFEKERLKLKHSGNQKQNEIEPSYKQLLQEGKKASTVNKEERNKTFLVFKNQFSSIAGKAIFIVLFLSICKEILYNRNHIEAIPIIEPFDFNRNPLQEIVSVIPTLILRFLVNISRIINNKLPDYKKPPLPQKIYDFSQVTRNIEVMLRENPTGSGTNPAGMARKSQKRNHSLNASIGISSNPNQKKNPDPVKRSSYNDQKKSNLRTCQFCKKDYYPNAPKQKYCCEECRVLAWEKKTGRKLKRKTKK